MNSLIALEDLGVLSVIGEDATSFLQGQITCDIHELDKNESQLSAFCNSKGKVIAIFVIAKTSVGFLLILPKSMFMTVQEWLESHKLRSNVEISEMDNVPVMKFLKSTTVRTPWIVPETSEQYVPQALKLDKLGAVSLTKEHYTGQEIVVRTHYLDEVKRQLQLSMTEPSARVEINCAIVDENDEEVGSVLLAQVRGLPYKVKDEITGDVIETKTINKMIVLCVLSTEAINSTLRLNNATRDILKIVGGGK